MDRIAVPLDGSRLAEFAIPPAVSLAVRSGARLDFVYVAEPLPYRTPTDDPPTREWGARYLADVSEQVRAVESVEIEHTLLEGHALECLVAHVGVSDPDLVVIATHGFGPLTRAWLGSVTDGFLRKGGVPVLVVRPPRTDERASFTAEPSLGKILVALDGSEIAEGALAVARRVGRITRASFRPAPRKGRRRRGPRAYERRGAVTHPGTSVLAATDLEGLADAVVGPTCTSSTPSRPTRLR